ncbi:MAG: hypothetical protein C4326_13910 [Ignavibacteria bacterium]
MPPLKQALTRFDLTMIAIGSTIGSGISLTPSFLWRIFNELISYVVFTDWIFFGLTAASVFVFRRRMP